MIVDVAFKLSASNAIPCDHGYFLSSAVSNVLPNWHGDSSIAIHPIAGQVIGARRMMLKTKSRLRIRIDAARIPECLPLAGKSLRIGRHCCQLGSLEVQPLTPAPVLRSRTVTIKGYFDASEFQTAVVAKVEAIGIEAEQVEIAKRRTLNIKGVEVVGFEVFLDALTVEQSLQIQAGQMWGRRRFGCGVFVPTHRGANHE